jgi:flagellar biosynthesis protein FlhF
VSNQALSTETSGLKKLRAPSVTECNTQLREIYGEGGFQIIDKQQVFSRGLIGLISGKTEWEVRYRTYPPARNKASPSFDEERQKILNIASKTSPAPYIAELSKKMEKLEESTEMINSTLGEIVRRKDVHPAIAQVGEILEKNEFSASFVRKISERLAKELTLEQLEDEQATHREVVRWIGEEVKNMRPAPYAKPPRVIALVGPTGVGKTTTIAKLAARYLIQQQESGYKPSMRLISIDKFRIAAYEQIEKYAEIMEINSARAESAKDIEECIKMDDGRLDILLIDTIGYSPNDYEGIAQMRKLLDVRGVNMEIYLTVSAATKASDLHTILRNYELFNYRSLIVTKCDETEHLGNIVSVLSEAQKTVTYITNGQNVTRNLEEATQPFFLHKLTGFSVGNDYIESLFPREPTPLETDENQTIWSEK